MKLRYKLLNGFFGLVAVAVAALAITISYSAPCESGPASVAADTGMKAIIYRCYGSADVLEWWIKSGPHRAMILSTWATEYGVRYVRDEESLYIHFWTVDFGRSGSQGATARAPRYVCTYTAQGQEGGSRLVVYRSEPCP